MLTVEGVLPEGAEAVSQDESELAVQENEPTPALEIDNDWGGGAGCPVNARKFMPAGDSEIAGGGITTFKFTAMLAGLLPAPTEVSSTWAL